MQTSSRISLPAISCAALVFIVMTACDKKDGASSGLNLTPKPPLTTETIPAELQKDTLYILHERHGLESFRISEARCNLKQTLGAWEFTLGLKAATPLHRVAGLTSDKEPKPELEVTTLLPPHRLDLKPGRILSQPNYFDPGRNVSLTNFLYYESNAVRDITIELLDVTNDNIEARITGTTGIKDSNTDTKLALVTRFQRDPAYGRTIK